MRLSIPKRLANWLIARAKRTPYFHIGDYMERYWLVPYTDPAKGNGCGWVSPFKRPIAWLIQLFGCSVRIHCIRRGDYARAFHDHPWNYTTILLNGEYYEETPLYNESNLYGGIVARKYRAGDVLRRPAKALHRIKMYYWHKPVWTLFIAGPQVQEWGFYPELRIKVRHDQYAEVESTS